MTISAVPEFSQPGNRFHSQQPRYLDTILAGISASVSDSNPRIRELQELQELQEFRRKVPKSTLNTKERSIESVK